MCGQDVMKQLRQSCYNQGFWIGVILSSLVWGIVLWITGGVR